LNRREREEYFYYLPAINFAEYLCSIGGIIAMWTGLCVFGQVRKLIQFLCSRKTQGKFDSVQLYNRALKLLKFVSLVICITFSMMQTWESLNQYLNYEYIIRMSTEVELIFPVIKIETFPNSRRNKIDHELFNSNAEMERKKQIESHLNKWSTIDCNIYTSINTSLDCKTYFNFEEYYRWCGNSLCSSLSIGIKSNVNSFSFDQKSVLKIERTYHFKSSPQTINQYFIKGEYDETVTTHQLVPGRNYQVSFTQRSIQLLPSPYKTDCMDYDRNRVNGFISDEECYHDCSVKLEIEKFGCSPNAFIPARVFFSQPFKYCDPNNLHQVENDAKCKQKCRPNCKLNNYDISIKTIENNKLVNLSVTSIIPHEKPYLSYIYTPKMDVDQLVYNLGGIASLWFGFSFFYLLDSLVNSAWKIFSIFYFI